MIIQLYVFCLVGSSTVKDYGQRGGKVKYSDNRNNLFVNYGEKLSLNFRRKA